MRQQRAKLTDARRGNVVSECAVKCVSYIEIRWASIRARIKSGGRSTVERVGRDDVDRVCPRIRGEGLESTREPAPELHLESVVIRGRIIFRDQESGRKAGRITQQTLAQQTAAESRDIGAGQTLISSQRLFNREIPFVDPRQLQIRIESVNHVQRARLRARDGRGSIISRNGNRYTCECPGS